MISTSLVALDASHRAPGVLAAARQIATAFGAKLVLFRAVSIPPEFPAAGAGTTPDTLERKLVADAVDALSSLAAQDTDLQSSVRVDRSKQPWRAILDAADDVAADLIVLGSHGFHGLDHLLGTTAAKVANIARRNVLVVHAEGPAPRHSA